MTIAILHHAGDGNVPPVRVPSTIALAEQHPSATIYVAVEGPEAHWLWQVFGTSRVHELHGARDTVDEIVLTMPAILKSGATEFYSSTEPGHVDRATLAARILFWRRGVRVIPWPSAPGKYRSPWHATLKTVCKALGIRAVAMLRGR